MKTKGNNFNASDKPKLAVQSLSEIMLNVLNDNLKWEEEKASKITVVQSIKKHTRKVVETMDIDNLDPKILEIIQSVAPPDHYKPNPDGSYSVFAERAMAIEKIMGKIG